MNKIVIVNPLIFTDLDGTLLDHSTYDFSPAEPVIRYLKRSGIPVIPNTSKTKAELIELQRELEIDDAFIVENGAAVYLPKTVFRNKDEEFIDSGSFWCRPFAKPRSHWISILSRLEPKYPGAFIGFSALSFQELSKLTGLTVEKARLAADRKFGEPLRWMGSDKVKRFFIQDIEAAGGCVLHGGRFLHVGDKVNKGAAMKWLTRFYRRSFPEVKHDDFVSIALGDSHNDVDMLEVADYAVVIRSPVQGPPALQRSERLLLTSETGPTGWAAALKKILGIPEEELQN